MSYQQMCILKQQDSLHKSVTYWGTWCKGAFQTNITRGRDKFGGDNNTDLDQMFTTISYEYIVASTINWEGHGHCQTLYLDFYYTWIDFYNEAMKSEDAKQC